MSNQNIDDLKKQRTKLLLKLADLSQTVRGSWVERYSTCSRPHCKCHQGERHGPRYYLVVNEDGRQRQKYISKNQVESVQRGIQQHFQMQEIITQITQINVQLIKEKAYGQD